MRKIKKLMSKIQKNKKISMLLGVILIAMAAVILIYLFYDLKKEKETTANADTQNISSDWTQVMDSEQIKSKSDLLDTENRPELDTSIDADYVINESFQISNMSDEVLPFINNNTAELSNALQQQLYINGFYNYTEARSNGYLEVDYNQKTVTLNFTIYANKTLTVDAIYNRTDNTWQIAIW